MGIRNQDPIALRLNCSTTNVTAYVPVDQPVMRLNNRVDIGIEEG